MTTTKSYDNLNRLDQIASVPSATSTLSFEYGYNDANQRTRATHADGSYWSYGYDGLGQVTSGKKHWSDDSLVAGQQFEYGFDDIGNPTSRSSGGDNGGANLRVTSYDASLVNQIVERSVPGYVGVIGTAEAAASVTVNLNPAVRKGSYWFGEALADNSAGAVWQEITNFAVLDNGANPAVVAKSTGYERVPKAQDVFDYDEDGNLTQNSMWEFTWDAENRLVKMVSQPTVPAAASGERWIEFEYDWRGRRIAKKVWHNTTRFGAPEIEERFVYDGWNLVAKLDSGSAITARFVWGLDLSGTEEGAGGVGGLLWMRALPEPAAQFCAYDGNGNVVGLVKGADGQMNATYEYGPFGELIRATGPLAKTNPFRFSTKHQDDETGLLYYGYRYYDPETGRFLSYDPAEADNLYAFVGNDSISSYDVLGLWGSGVHKEKTILWAKALYYLELAAKAIGNADVAVDGRRWLPGSGKGWAPWIGDQSYHFNRNMGGGDSRLEHNIVHMWEAMRACSLAIDDPEEAARLLGTALHPLQDWVAHGDFFVKWVGPITAVHNMYSTNRQPGVSKTKVVDDVDYDAVLPDGSIAPDGRAAGAAMRYYNLPPPVIKRGEVPSGPGMLVDWAEFKYVGEASSLRLKKTKELTERDLKSFRDYVRVEGGCRCKKYFGFR